jgi:hypothetical protein
MFLETEMLQRVQLGQGLKSAIGVDSRRMLESVVHVLN